MLEIRAKSVAGALGLAVAAVVSLSGVSHAALIHQAYSIDNPPQSGNQAWTGSLGMDFDVCPEGTCHIKVRQLGFFDSNDDGIMGTSTAITVALYDRTDTSTALASQTFTFGSDGDLMNGYRFKDIETLSLNSGLYTVLAWGFNNDDPNGNQNNAGGPVVLTDGAGLLDFVSTRFSASTGDAGGTVSPFDPLCTEPSGLGPSCFAAGSFKYTVAEPGTLAILGLGLAGLGIARRQKRRKVTPAKN